MPGRVSHKPIHQLYQPCKSVESKTAYPCVQLATVVVGVRRGGRQVRSPPRQVMTREMNLVVHYDIVGLHGFREPHFLSCLS